MTRRIRYGLIGTGAATAALAAHDLLQKKHSVLRNYPVIGHMRYLLEELRPELQQYFIERNWDGRPFDRDTRSIIYEPSKGIHGEQAFGTELYEWLHPGQLLADPPRSWAEDWQAASAQSFTPQLAEYS